MSDTHAGRPHLEYVSGYGQYKNQVMMRHQFRLDRITGCNIK